MKTLNDILKKEKPLNESFDLLKVAKSNEFIDSGDATAYMEYVSTVLESDALMNWADVTDSNFGTKTAKSLDKVIKEYDKFLKMMYAAGE